MAELKSLRNLLILLFLVWLNTAPIPGEISIPIYQNYSKETVLRLSGGGMTDNLENKTQSIQSTQLPKAQSQSKSQSQSPKTGPSLKSSESWREKELPPSLGGGAGSPGSGGGSGSGNDENYDLEIGKKDSKQSISMDESTVISNREFWDKVEKDAKKQCSDDDTFCSDEDEEEAEDELEFFDGVDEDHRRLLATPGRARGLFRTNPKLSEATKFKLQFPDLGLIDVDTDPPFPPMQKVEKLKVQPTREADNKHMAIVDTSTKSINLFPIRSHVKDLLLSADHRSLRKLIWGHGHHIGIIGYPAPCRVAEVGQYQRDRCMAINDQTIQAAITKVLEYTTLLDPDIITFERPMHENPNAVAIYFINVRTGGGMLFHKTGKQAGKLWSGVKFDPADIPEMVKQQDVKLIPNRVSRDPNRIPSEVDNILAQATPRTPQPTTSMPSPEPSSSTKGHEL